MLERRTLYFFAGIWGGSPDSGFCAAILTEPAAPNLSHIHSRQPVVLDPGCRYDWLDPSLTERNQVKQVAKRFDPEKLVSWPLKPKMNCPDASALTPGRNPQLSLKPGYSKFP